MSSPLFNEMMRNTPMGQPMQIMQQFNQFRQTFKGNPQEEVQKLLDSGRMSQDQFKRLSEMANQLQKFLQG